MSDRGGPDHHLIETAQCLNLRTDELYGCQLPDILTATFPEACSWSTVPMATFPEVCFWELSYVNVPTVNLQSHSMNVAIRTRYAIPPHYLTAPHCSYALHVPAFGYA